MNILIDDINQDERLKDLNTDFRACILFELLMQDPEIDNNMKLYRTIKLFYGDKEVDLEKAVDNIIWFYSGGKDFNVPGKSKSNGRKIYSFEYDADLIYSAFLTQYGIDLQDIEYLHWWKFMAMFSGLNKNNLIVDYMTYRSMDLSKIKDKETRKQYRELQNACRIPDMRDEEQKAVDFSVFW